MNTVIKENQQKKTQHQSAEIFRCTFIIDIELVILQLFGLSTIHGISFVEKAHEV
jgi:cell division protein FtsB